ncbi:geranylgeranylglyceryl/heptaprenylglyceryl phosphate synthase [Fervidicoccus fontis]|uniref:Geranylgeranylglyceryl phosphate synthase n=4 Tax=Fervidicoccus fontis TaxID=683846 RepID=I0A1J5_FERFK|nr:PcrB-like protein [Fervidicoccus fontis Kam940]MBE9391637.1 geranylgeranylglyceryl/heptaprenylglyceryl phosphate synthase [Fervidicoccus fontis]PMB75964.1 MAG: geranylgeranylglyceryl/heptaprenylglyceryl phosphate synthase [Fervidicoccus fontis]PMB77851.1 MAG: geranylgeranylglyceryl/heptaprenylglyceryl phosphate synthase [Fervidicoccus fontis]HEW63475.1 geranylgeranylglyceryl/heptaprenylglyceryl phosphate synthase [Fervidicoccus fontis]
MKVLKRMKVKEYLEERRKFGTLHFTLIDPHKTNAENAEKIASILKDIGTDAFLLGGSIGVDPIEASEIALKLKETGLPVIIFPGDLTNIVKTADAILFMSLLNSENPYHIIGAQVQGAFLVKKYGLETLPTAYIVIGYGGAAGYMGMARPIPWDQVNISIAYALAANMLGMRYIYLEAGSGSPQHIPPEVIKSIKKTVPEAFLIVGGGIRTKEAALSVAEAGADAIVTGNIVEEDIKKAEEIIKAIKKKD